MSKYTLIRIKDVARVTGLSRSTIYNQIADGLLPHGLGAGKRTTVYPLSEITEVMNARIAGKSPELIRALVARMQAERANAGREL